MTKPVQTIIRTPDKRMAVDLQVQRATCSVAAPDDEQFRLWVELVVADEGPGLSKNNLNLAIRIVDEEEGLHFNRKYRDQDHATNVLSFPAELPEGLPSVVGQSHLGDLLVCAPVVAREAMEQGKPEINHWAHLIIHGVLHLLGYDHERGEDAVIMETLETAYLARLEIPDPYKAGI